LQGLIIPPRPVQGHQAHRTPKPSGHAVSSSAALSREHGPWFEPGSKYRLFWCLASFLVPAPSQCEGANFCTLCHFRNYCHLCTLQLLCALPALPPLPALGGKFVHLEPNHLAWGKSLQLGVPHGARGGAPVDAFVAKPNETKRLFSRTQLGARFRPRSYRPVFDKDSGRPIGLAATLRLHINFQLPVWFRSGLSCHLSSRWARGQNSENRVAEMLVLGLDRISTAVGSAPSG
jgi:hypothetical protein